MAALRPTLWPTPCRITPAIGLQNGGTYRMCMCARTLELALRAVDTQSSWLFHQRISRLRIFHLGQHIIRQHFSVNISHEHMSIAE